MKVYLSPHLDDAVLSCGGSIHQQAAAGETVWVITLFAGDVGPGAVLSPFARQQHTYWGGVLRPMALRRAEDQAALTLLGAEAWHLDYHDAVYRTDTEGRWLYPDLTKLFGPVHPADPLVSGGVQDIAARISAHVSGERIEQTILFAPLGVGSHADHSLTLLVAQELMGMGHRLAFYEDYPYSERPGTIEAALAQSTAAGWRSQIISLAAKDLSAKVSALSYYRSQLAVLFGGVEAMPNRVWTFAATRSADAGLAERIWWPQ